MKYLSSVKSLPGAPIVLYGEEDIDGSAIRLYPYWHFSSVVSKTFDLTFNQDSFPEIDSNIVNWYLDLILNNTRDFFLSINQEGQAIFDPSGKKQLLVPELLKDRKAYKLVYRFPYWLRGGYTEELYRIVR